MLIIWNIVFMLLEQEKQKKAAELLNKLLNAALKAQKEGKYIALQKLVFEANKVSSHLSKIMDNDPSLRDKLYTPVMGVVIE
jgi:hypothetical protein